MVVQPRALVTRQKIIDTAVKVFAQNGYLETDLKAITRAADLTNGAFYYHFDSKEALVAVIIEQGWSHVWDLIADRLDATEPGLENVIATTIAMTDQFAQDEFVWVASQLHQAFGLLQQEGRRDLQQRFEMFVEKVAKNIHNSDIRDDVTQREVGELIWIMMQGSNQIHAPLPRAVKNWIFLLRSVVPLESLPHFEQVLTRTAAQYGVGAAEVSDRMIEEATDPQETIAEDDVGSRR